MLSITKIKENVYAITDGSTQGNVAAYVLTSQIIFIDSGMNIPLMKKFREHVENETGKKTSILVITHAHADHVFGNQVFKDCKIFTSKPTNKKMLESKDNDWTPETIEEWKKSAEDPTTLEGLEITLATDTFEDDFVITDEDVQVIIKRTGGHTEGSSCVYCPNYKVLTVGDNLFNDRFPGAGDKSANPLRWIDALNHYLSMDVEHVIPGHGPVSGKDKIQEFRDYVQKVVDLMKDMIAEGKTEEEIITKANEISYHPPRSQEWKNISLKKWLEVVSK
ncbi:MAG: MBL fold metallo-hydrolase [Promethearchaeota archaeon]